MAPKDEQPKPSTPQRLDTLSGRRGGASAGSSNGSGAASGTRGKFIPKAVARRSKAERDATAPAEKAEVSTETNVKKEGGGSNHPLSGRGGRGGAAARGGRGRGRGRFEPVAMAAVGPLAAPSSMANDRRSNTPSFESRGIFGGSPSADLNALRVKSETPGVESDASGTPMPDGGESFRIDMSSNEISAGHISQYFPVRLDKVEPEAEDELVVAPADSKGDLKKQQEEETLQDGVKIKSEPMDDDNNLSPAPPQPTPRAYISPQEEKEKKRLEEDHETITNEFNIKASLDDNRSKALEQKLYFFQFPAVLPDFKKKDSTTANNDNNDNDNDVVMLENDQPSGSAAPEETNNNNKVEPSSQIPDGFAGRLRLHKSGKLTMKLGNIEMDVTQGTESGFLQDVVYTDNEAKRSYLIGQISRKMVVAPNVEKLVHQ